MNVKEIVINVNKTFKDLQNDHSLSFKLLLRLKLLN